MIVFKKCGILLLLHCSTWNISEYLTKNLRSLGVAMLRTICVANQKGGVGKTTTSVNLAAALARRGKKVLIFDMDPQGNASSGLGVKRYDQEAGNAYHVLIGEKNINDVMQQSSEDNLYVVAANPDLVGAEIELVEVERREYRLKDEIKLVKDQFDYCIIDCPPSLGLLTVNALSAADTFLVPLQCEYYALEGLSQLLNTAGLIKKNLNQELKIEGIVLTMFDTRNNLSHQVVSEIQAHFQDKVFKSIIPRTVRLSEAPSHGLSIFEYDSKSIGAKKYNELAKELDERVEAEKKEHLQANSVQNQEDAIEPEKASEVESIDEIKEDLKVETQPEVKEMMREPIESENKEEEPKNEVEEAMPISKDADFVPLKLNDVSSEGESNV